MNRENIPVLAIDGPAGVGKSTIACRLARLLGYNILLSGSLYRIFGMKLHEQGTTADDVAAIEALVANTKIQFILDDDQLKTYVNATAVDADIYREKYAQIASSAAKNVVLRKALLPIQRQFRCPPGLVAEGRDMGSVVFSDAELKIFLQADIKERVRRRHLQLRKNGVYVTVRKLYEELLQRDRRDSERSIAQLKITADAVVIDTTELSEAELMDELMKVVSIKLNR